jgi:hypothetical protein
MKLFPLFLLGFCAAGCYDTFTRDELESLGPEPVVIWVVEGPHYHISEWKIDEKGDLSGKGKTCQSLQTDFNHAPVNGSDFSGTIPKNEIVRIKTSSVQVNSDIVLLIGLAAVAGLLLALIAFGGTSLP